MLDVDRRIAALRKRHAGHRRAEQVRLDALPALGVPTQECDPLFPLVLLDSELRLGHGA